MEKIPVGIKEYQDAYQDILKMIERLGLGYRLLSESQKQSSLTRSFTIIQQYQELIFEMIRRVEEMMLIHQFFIFGKKMYIRRNGQVMQLDDVVTEGTIEVDAQALLLFHHLHEVFGEVPWDMLVIKE
jgi:Na+/H+-dicarboxylate symporter